MDRDRQTFNLISLDEIFQLLTLAKQRSIETHAQVLVSLTKPLPSTFDPINVFALARRTNTIVNLWALPAKESSIVGIGVAAEISSEGPLRFKKAAAQLQNMIGSAVVEPKTAPGPIFLGGFRFKSELPPDGPWQEFHDGLLSLPRWMLASTAGRSSLTINATLDSQTDVEALRKELTDQALNLFRRQEHSPQPAAASVIAEPMQDDWGKKVVEVLDAIKDGEVSKVTLARIMKLRAQANLSPEPILRSLTANYPECRTFAFSRRGGSFVGASPEELVSLNGEKVTSTCLAGSAPRGETEKTDFELSNWLLGNEKERREHKVVVDWVSERMGSLCNKLHWNDVPCVLRLGNVQHLATDFVGTRANGRHVLDFVEALHPTPAVGGIPLGPALEMISRLEDFDRGWYTGPVGWVDMNGNGEFAIAIRCALLRGNEAFLYAGDGIVAGSDPDTEERETAMKFKPLLSALGAP
jgi:isochorismate synthase